MKEKDKNQIILRKFIRKLFLQEYLQSSGGFDSNNDIQSFNMNPWSYRKFPYGTNDYPENMQNLNKIQDIVDIGNKSVEHFNKSSNNNDIYEFPFEEFKIGLEFEKEIYEKNNYNLDILGIAEKVINNIRKNKNFYTDLNNELNNIDVNL